MSFKKLLFSTCAVSVVLGANLGMAAGQSPGPNPNLGPSSPRGPVISVNTRPNSQSIPGGIVGGDQSRGGAFEDSRFGTNIGQDPYLGRGPNLDQGGSTRTLYTSPTGEVWAYNNGSWSRTNTWVNPQGTPGMFTTPANVTYTLPVDPNSPTGYAPAVPARVPALAEHNVNWVQGANGAWSRMWVAPTGEVWSYNNGGWNRTNTWVNPQGTPGTVTTPTITTYDGQTYGGITYTLPQNPNSPTGYATTVPALVGSNMQWQQAPSGAWNRVWTNPNTGVSWANGPGGWQQLPPAPPPAPAIQ